MGAKRWPDAPLIWLCLQQNVLAAHTQRQQRRQQQQLAIYAATLLQLCCQTRAAAANWANKSAKSATTRALPFSLDHDDVGALV